ncbi:MAG: PLP-dependent aminotransferase family protein [Pseudomonadales bacterium]|nr:PLP-dependent aminotransferase family protein [Pseudomonadales bacterium]
MKDLPLYEQIADQMHEQIRNGVYRSGDKLPSVRSHGKTLNVSISTMLTAYGLLEDRGLVEVKPKSGYFVKAHRTQTLPEPKFVTETVSPTQVTSLQRVMEVLKASADPGNISFGAAVPAADFPALTHLKSLFAQKARQGTFMGVGYDSVHGNQPLRREVAKKAVVGGVYIAPEEVVLTSGCQGGIALCLRTLTRPGDIIAIESPCYYGMLQLVEALQLKAIEIPSDASTGMSVEALKLALEQWPIKAIVCIPNYNNPVGALMPDDHKQALLELANYYDLPVIEDDIYGDLGYQSRRPRTVKSYDTQGRVLLCSSVSKTLDPQLGIGWILPGRYLQQLQYERFINSVFSLRLQQQAVAEMLAHGGYDRHLRTASEAYKQRRDHLLDLVARHFPKGTRISTPLGGFVTWIQLPLHIDATRLYLSALAKGIVIAPGELFSTNPNKFRHSFRVSYAEPWTPEREKAIATLAHLVAQEQ